MIQDVTKIKNLEKRKLSWFGSCLPKVLCLQVFIIFGQGGVLGLVVLLFHLHLPLGIHLDLWGQESWHGYKFEVGVSDQLAGQPQEGLLKVVI